MAALLRRTRGESPIISGPPSAERRRNKRKSDAPAESPAPEKPIDEAPVPVLDLPVSTGDLQRRPQPAVTTDLAAMRELANIQARAAIDTHGQKRSLNRAYGTLGTSIACLAAGFYVLYYAESLVMRASAMLIVTVGAFWMVTGLLAAKNVLDTMRRKKRPGLRAMLEEVEAEIAAVQSEAEQAETDGGAAGSRLG
jgi:hypothetical protein